MLLGQHVMQCIFGWNIFSAVNKIPLNCRLKESERQRDREKDEDSEIERQRDVVVTKKAFSERIECKSQLWLILQTNTGGIKFYFIQVGGYIERE